MPAPKNRIAECRRASGLKRVDVASRVGVGEVAVARWEDGTHAPRDSHKLILADLFGVSVTWLMGWTDEGNGNGDHREKRAA